MMLMISIFAFDTATAPFPGHMHRFSLLFRALFLRACLLAFHSRNNRAFYICPQDISGARRDAMGAQVYRGHTY